MTTMDDLIHSLNGGAHVSQDLRALQDYLSQNIHPPTLSFLTTNTSTYRPLPPSRSTSTTRDPHPYSQPHESYLPTTYETPLPTPSFSTEPPSQTSSRPRVIRRSSSYDFSMSNSGTIQSRGTSPYTEFSAFESDAFAPLVQETCQVNNGDPWARWKQQSPESSSVWSAFGRQQQPQIQGIQKQMPVYGMQGTKNQFGSGGLNRYQSPRGRNMEAPPTPPDEDDEMGGGDTEMQDEDEDAVEREMALGLGGEEDDQEILRPGSAPGRLGINWTEQGFGGSNWERGRRNM